MTTALGARDTSSVAGIGLRSALSGVLLVANQQSASASVIHLGTGKVVHLEVGAGPHETAISTDGRRGVVSVYGAREPGHQLAIVDIAGDSIVRMIELGRYARPHDVTFLPGSLSRVAVTSEATQRVIIVDITTGTIEGEVETRARGSHMLALAGDGATAFTANVGDGSISHVDLSSRQFLRQIPIAPRVEGIAITPDGSTVWAGSNDAGTVSIFDVASGKITDTLKEMGMPYRIAISPDGKTAAIPDPQGNRLIIADVASRKVVGEITGIGSPRGVDFAPDNRTAFVTLGPEGAVSVVDLVERKQIARYQVQESPDGVSWGSEIEGF
jgi:DNA-binding beta-propeller fold protein YncE